MELYKRTKIVAGKTVEASPFWYFDFTDANGKRIKRSTRQTKRSEALKVSREMVARGISNTRSLPLGALVSAKDAIVAYVEHLESQKKPWAAYAARYKRKLFGLDVFGQMGDFAFPQDLRLDQINAGLLDRLKEARRKEGASSQTIAHEIKVLRSAALLAKERGANVADIRWNVPTGTSKTRYLSLEEWRRVYVELDPNRRVKGPQGAFGPHVSPAVRQSIRLSRDLFVALSMCGGRWGEVSRLTADQVSADFTKLRVFGSKTQRERIVPVPAIMQSVLRRRVAQASKNGTPYLFPGLNGKGHLVRSNSIVEAMNRAGLNAPHLVERDGKATIHSLRHTFASWLLQEGVGLSEVQDLLGHQSVEVTRRYAHLAVAKTVEKASAALTGIMERNP